jgi:hypothetical protein
VSVLELVGWIALGWVVGFALAIGIGKWLKHRSRVR